MRFISNIFFTVSVTLKENIFKYHALCDSICIIFNNAGPFFNVVNAADVF